MSITKTDWIVRLSVCLALVLGGAVLTLVPQDTAYATINYFSDDFEDGDPMDGSPVTWAPWGEFPGEYAIQDIDDPPDGELEYIMAPTLGVTRNFMLNLALDVDAGDMSVRTQVAKIQDTPGGAASIGVLARVNPIDPNLAFADYTYYWGLVADGELAIGREDSPGGSTTLNSTSVDFDLTQEDVLLQFDLVGSYLGLRAWRPGEPMPSVPQVLAVDATHASGSVGLISGDGLGDAIGVFRSVDVGVPEPPTLFGVQPAATYAVLDETFDDSGDSANDVSVSAAAAVGEVDGANTNHLSRVVVKFALPDAPAGSPTLQEATLRAYVRNAVGSPPGPVSVWHSQADNDGDQLASDYEDGSYADTLGDLAQPTDETGRYFELDVTELVKADYATDGLNLMSAFRLQMDEVVFHEDDVSHGYSLAMPASPFRPQLLLTFIPEPAAGVLILLGMAGVLFAARRDGHCSIRNG